MQSKSKNSQEECQVADNRRNGRQENPLLPKLITHLILYTVAISLLVTLYVFSRRFFVTRNPHFTYRELFVTETEHFSLKNVKPMMESKHYVYGENNLFDINLRDIHDTLSKEPLIERAEVRRILPNAIKIDIKERTPIAFLSGGKVVQALVDDTGVIFPYCGFNGSMPNMPFIVGIQNMKNATGKNVSKDKLLLAAVEFIKHFNAREQIDGAGFDISAIQLNYSRERLECNLTPRYDNKCFPAKGAVTYFPGNVELQPAALDRLDTIMTIKVKNNETMSFADLTLENNVPTRD